MKRSPIKRTPLQPSRQRIKPVSDHRRGVNVERWRLLEERFGPRDDWTCQLRALIGTPCFGDIHGHEVLSRERSGRKDSNLLGMDGILLSCDYHNGWVDTHPIEAHGLGLAKHSWE